MPLHIGLCIGFRAQPRIQGSGFSPGFRIQRAHRKNPRRDSSLANSFAIAQSHWQASFGLGRSHIHSSSKHAFGDGRALRSRELLWALSEISRRTEMCRCPLHIFRDEELKMLGSRGSQVACASWPSLQPEHHVHFQLSTKAAPFLRSASVPRPCSPPMSSCPGPHAPASPPHP